VLSLLNLHFAIGAITRLASLVAFYSKKIVIFVCASHVQSGVIISSYPQCYLHKSVHLTTSSPLFDIILRMHHLAFMYPSPAVHSIDSVLHAFAPSSPSYPNILQIPPLCHIANFTSVLAASPSYSLQPLAKPFFSGQYMLIDCSAESLGNIFNNPKRSH
jgi:hypothetical protein